MTGLVVTPTRQGAWTRYFGLFEWGAERCGAAIGCVDHHGLARAAHRRQVGEWLYGAGKARLPARG